MSIRRFFLDCRIIDHHISILNEECQEVFDGNGNLYKGIIKDILEDETILCEMMVK